MAVLSFVIQLALLILKQDWLKQCNQTDSVWLTFTRHLTGIGKTRYSIDRVSKLLKKLALYS